MPNARRLTGTVVFCQRRAVRAAPTSRFMPSLEIRRTPRQNQARHAYSKSTGKPASPIATAASHRRRSRCQLADRDIGFSHSCARRRYTRLCSGEVGHPRYFGSHTRRCHVAGADISGKLPECCGCYRYGSGRDKECHMTRVWRAGKRTGACAAELAADGMQCCR